MFSTSFTQHLKANDRGTDDVDNYESVWISEFEGSGTFEVAVGDFVEVFAPENIGLVRNGHGVWICQVKALFRAEEETQMFKPTWFYSLYDTILENDADEVPGLIDEELPRFDSRELFAVSEEDAAAMDQPNKVGSIYRKTYVHMIGSGSRPENLPENEYFVRFSYSKKYYTFRDLCPLQFCTAEFESKKVYKMLELYSGCGGFSFIGQKLNDYTIKHSYAVDNDRDSIKTYKLNHPQTRTFVKEVDYFLNRCKGLLKIYEQYLPEAIDAIVPDESSVSFDECKVQISYLCEIFILLGLQICDLSLLDTDHATVGVRDADCPSKSNYIDCQTALETGIITLQDLQDFLWKLRRSKPIPLPQDIDIIIGGPPCQGLSRKNLNSDGNDIFSSTNNIQIKHFLRSIAFFKPRFVVLENVPEMFEKECGLYIQFVITHLITLGYQLHCGILSSACYGAPQMRLRCFVIAALSGYETLPPFPHPTFNPLEKLLATRKQKMCSNAKSCVVEVNPTIAPSLQPPTLIWDAFEDLPFLDNWSMIESVQYRMPAQRPYQCYLRRNEESGPEFMHKAKLALLELKPDAQSRIDALLELYYAHNNGENNFEALLKLGEEACVTSQTREIYWRKHLDTLPEEEQSELETTRMNVILNTGRHLKKLIDEFCFDYKGPCFNHRCTTTHKGEELRIRLLPPNGGDFTSLPGVVRTRNYVCAGHVHGRTASRDRAGRLHIRDCCPLHEASEKTRMLHGAGCKSYTEFVGTGDLAVPRWVVQSWNRKKGSPKNVYGRMEATGVVGTLLTSVKPSCGYPVIHPFENRFLSVREVARIQGFPDDYIFLADDRATSKPLSGMESLDSRFKQIGNSVSPPLASMIGKALLNAIMYRKEVFPDVYYIADNEVEQAVRKAPKSCYFTEKQEELNRNSDSEEEVIEVTEVMEVIEIDVDSESQEDNDPLEL